MIDSVYILFYSGDKEVGQVSAGLGLPVPDVGELVMYTERSPEGDELGKAEGCVERREFSYERHYGFGTRRTVVRLYLSSDTPSHHPSQSALTREDS